MPKIVRASLFKNVEANVTIGFGGLTHEVELDFGEAVRGSFSVDGTVTNATLVNAVLRGSMDQENWDTIESVAINKTGIFQYQRPAGVLLGASIFPELSWPYYQLQLTGDATTSITGLNVNLYAPDENNKIRPLT